MGNVPTINAIPTQYKGIEFRSRTEARWAVFLTELGIEWEYEPEGYQLLSGWYLPDFWLPQIDAFLEVKPSEDGDDSRWNDLVAMTNKRLFVTAGAPGSSEPMYGPGSHMPAVEVIAYAPYGADEVVVEKEDMNTGFGTSTEEVERHKARVEAYGRSGGYYDAPYFFCKCYGCGKWGCEYDGRSGRIDCGCVKGEKEYTADYTRGAMQVAANYRFWNPGGAS